MKTPGTISAPGLDEEKSCMYIIVGAYDILVGAFGIRTVMLE